MRTTAARAALRKKKQLESTLEQTSAQIMNLEGQIASIETANINKETLDALSNASKAMKTIHGGLTIDKVDATMYVSSHPCLVYRWSVYANLIFPSSQGGSRGATRHQQRNRQRPYPGLRRQRRRR